MIYPKSSRGLFPYYYFCNIFLRNLFFSAHAVWLMCSCGAATLLKGQRKVVPLEQRQGHGILWLWCWGNYVKEEWIDPSLEIGSTPCLPARELEPIHCIFFTSMVEKQKPFKCSSLKTLLQDKMKQCNKMVIIWHILCNVIDQTLLRQTLELIIPVILFRDNTTLS